MSCGLLRSLDDLPLAWSAFRPRSAYRRRALVDHVQRYLTLHAGERVRLKDIGRAVGASPGYVAEAFREVVGVPPYRYQLELRLTRARALLVEHDDLARLALDLGFSSHSHFTTAFRHRFGDTPAALRARIRNGRAAGDTEE